MRGDTAETCVHPGECLEARGAPPRRWLSVNELVAAGCGRLDGPAWRDVRLLSMSLGGSGTVCLPATAFYAVLTFARPGRRVLSDGEHADELDGTMIVNGPGRELCVSSEHARRATWVCIEPRVLSAAAADCGLREPPRLHVGAVPLDAVCERLLGALVEEGKTAWHPLQELIVASIANALACRLVTRFAGRALDAVGAPGALSMRAFRDVRAYIEERLDERLSLDELARVAGVSRFHFARQFRLRTGESPMGFLLRARIERGKRLLCESAVSIGDVAAALGFADQSHFTRTFKRIVGVPPRKYKGGVGELT